MRIVATSDTHMPINPKVVPDGDVLIVAGDFMLSGFLDEWYPAIDAIAALPHKTKIIVGGNHDRWLEDHFDTALKDLTDRGLTYVGWPTIPLHQLRNGMTLLGLPFVKDLPRWAFNRREDWIAKYLQEMPQVDVVVSHSPAFEILDGVHSYGHIGIEAYNKYQKKHPPKIWICGHVHEARGSQKVGKTTFYNVAHCDEQYNQTNHPFVIDL